MKQPNRSKTIAWTVVSLVALFLKSEESLGWSWCHLDRQVGHCHSLVCVAADFDFDILVLYFTHNRPQILVSASVVITGTVGATSARDVLFYTQDEVRQQPRCTHEIYKSLHNYCTITKRNTQRTNQRV